MKNKLLVISFLTLIIVVSCMVYFRKNHTILSTIPGWSDNIITNTNNQENNNICDSEDSIYQEYATIKDIKFQYNFVVIMIRESIDGVPMISIDFKIPKNKAFIVQNGVEKNFSYNDIKTHSDNKIIKYQIYYNGGDAFCWHSENPCCTKKVVFSFLNENYRKVAFDFCVGLQQYSEKNCNCVADYIVDNWALEDTTNMTKDEISDILNNFSAGYCK